MGQRSPPLAFIPTCRWFSISLTRDVVSSHRPSCEALLSRLSPLTLLSHRSTWAHFSHSLAFHRSPWARFSHSSPWDLLSRSQHSFSRCVVAQPLWQVPLCAPRSCLRC